MFCCRHTIAEGTLEHSFSRNRGDTPGSAAPGHSRIGGIYLWIGCFGLHRPLCRIISKSSLRNLTAGRGGRLVGIAAVTVLIWPAIATGLATLSGADHEPKLVALNLMRASGYLSMFATAYYLGSRGLRPWPILVLHSIGFTFICLCGIAQHGLDIGLDLWNAVSLIGPASQWYAFGDGFMGLYRGAVGAWGSGILSITPMVLLAHRTTRWLSPPVLIIVLAAIFTTGSRQGVLIGGAGVLVSIVAHVLFGPTPAPARLLRACCLIGLLTAMGLGIFDAGGDRAFISWIQERFDPSTAPTSVFDRDIRTAVVLDKVTDDTIRFVTGVGWGNVSAAPPGGPFEVVYVDSEFFGVLQMGGLVGLGCYVFFIFSLASELKPNAGTDYLDRVAAIATTVALLAGVTLTAGHFFLLTYTSSQAPIAYWNWAVFGLLTGSIGRSKAGLAKTLALRQRQRSRCPRYCVHLLDISATIPFHDASHSGRHAR